MSTILDFEISGDSSKYEKAMKNAQSMAKSAAGVIGSSFGAIASMAIATYGALDSLKASLDTADQLNKLAKSTGIATEELSAYKYAADLSGVSIEQTALGINKLAKNMAEAAGGNQEMARTFAIMGVTVKDASGNLLPTNQVLNQISDTFSHMPDGATKASLAMQVFGKSGAELIPLLNEGSAGIARMREEAERSGQIIGTEAAQAAERFNDNIEKLSKVVQGSANILMQAYVPALEAATNKMLDFLGITGNAAEKHLLQQKEAFEKQLTIFEGTAQGTGSVDKYLSWIPGYVTKEQAEQGVKEMKARIGLINKTLEKMKFEGVAPFAQSLVGDIRAPEIKLPDLQGEKAAAAWRKEIEKLQLGAMPTDTLGQQFAKIDAMRQEDVRLTIEEGRQKEISEGLIQEKIFAINEKYAKEKLDLQRKTDEKMAELMFKQEPPSYEAAPPNLALQAQADLEKFVEGQTNFYAQLLEGRVSYSDSLENLNNVDFERLVAWEEAKAQATLTQTDRVTEALSEAYNQRAELAKSAEEQILNWILGSEVAVTDSEKRKRALQEQTVGSMIDNAAYMFKTLGEQNKTAFAAFKAISIAQTMIKTYESATAAYAAMAGIPIVGPALGAAAAASAIWAGLANVAKIANMEPGGGAGGGGGGGAVGTYSASPTTGLPTAYPAAAEAGQGEQRSSLTINIEGDMIGDEGYVELLAEKISQAVESRDVRLVASNAQVAQSLS